VVKRTDAFVTSVANSANNALNANFIVASRGHPLLNDTLHLIASRLLRFDPQRIPQRPSSQLTVRANHDRAEQAFYWSGSICTRMYDALARHFHLKTCPAEKLNFSPSQRRACGVELPSTASAAERALADGIRLLRQTLVKPWDGGAPRHAFVDPNDRKLVGFDHYNLANTHIKDSLTGLSSESLRWRSVLCPHNCLATPRKSVPARPRQDHV